VNRKSLTADDQDQTPHDLTQKDLRGAANGTPRYESTPGSNDFLPLTMIGSPAEVSGYMVTDGGAAELVPAVPVAVEGATADTLEAISVADVAIAVEAEETEEASCRLSRGEAMTPVKASSGRR
jgi:hypothetical protein